VRDYVARRRPEILAEAGRALDSPVNHGERTHEEDPMPAPQVRLELIDATELAEGLTFISQWLAGPDHAQLAASFGRFVGTDSYDLTALPTDLPHFTCSEATTASNSSATTKARLCAASARTDRAGAAVGSLTTGVPESPRKKSGRRCRIGAEVFVAGVRGRPRGAPPGRREPRL
jgi:hypothetical protein